MHSKDEQFLNVYSSMFFKDSGRETLFRLLQSLNADLPRFVRELGRLTLSKLTHPKKASSLIVLREFGRIICLILEFLNAMEAISVTVSGIVMLTIPLAWNSPCGIRVTPSSNSTVLIFWQLSNKISA